MPSTIQLHRVLSAPPERVYRAFTDPDAMVKWLPPHGFTAKVHHIDVPVGGSYKMSFTKMKADSDSAHVPVPPPLMLLASILIGVSLHFLYPLHWVSGLGRWLPGSVLFCLGLGTILYCAGMFRKAETAIEPWKTTSRIVTSGPYRWSRNPIYLSFVIGGLGIAFLLDNLWIAIMQVPLVVALIKVVIRREERYLEGKFGDSYRSYKAHVRRWI